jgi:hypothetical protein
LDDPKTFSLMPPTVLLSHRHPDDAGRGRSCRRRSFLPRKYFTRSKVRPAVWVAWRDFGRNAQTLLRGSAPAVAPTEPQPIGKIQPLAPKPLPISPAIAKTPAVESSSRLRGNENVFGRFADAARAWLPAATIASLDEKVVATKISHPEMGFMKHFKRIAEIEFPCAEFDRIGQAALRPDASGA